MSKEKTVDNVIGWEYARTPEFDMEYTLVMGSVERIASFKTTDSMNELSMVVQIPAVSEGRVEFVIIKLWCGCEWKATSDTQGVNRVCDQHYIQDIIGDNKWKIDNEGKDDADD
jgi:hypothetical protein